MRQCITILAVLFALGLLADAAVARPSQQTAERNFTGAGSCASSSCHGSVWPRTGGKIDQNEYFVWASKDKHSKAYSVLLEPRSKRIARNMRIDRPETDAACLNCHAVNAPAAKRAATFEISDGVGCESCHGPASAWLGPHTGREWTHNQSVAVGMTDTRDIRRRAEVCLSCHLGNEEKSVNHQLIAAGHPSLLFELDTFSALMPVHWKSDRANASGVRRLAIGQAIALRESMRQLARRARDESWSVWPDFADFECSACHHELITPSARQERGYTGKPGTPPWNESSYIVFRVVAGAMTPALQKPLDDLVAQLKSQIERGAAGRVRLAEIAGNVASLMDQMTPQLEKVSVDRPLISRMLRNIAADSDAIARSGIRSAEQATMAVDVLYNSLTEDSGKKEPAFSAHIDALYNSLQSAPRYDANQFAALLKRIRDFAP